MEQPAQGSRPEEKRTRARPAPAGGPEPPRAEPQSRRVMEATAPEARAPRPYRDAGPPDYGDVGYDAPGAERSRRYSQMSERNRCRFCREKVTRVDYKDVLTLQKLCTNQGRIFSRKRSGNCAAHQRMVKLAIKQARFMGLLSYTT